MTRYIIGAFAAAALALAGCNDHKAGTGYSGKQANGNDTAYQQGTDTRADLRNDGTRGAGSDNSVSGVSANGDTRHDNDFNNNRDTTARNDRSDKDLATGQDLKKDSENPANAPVGQMMSISGTVKDAGHSSLTLVTGSKGEIKLNTGDFTKVTGLNGQMVKPGDIKEGAEVRAAYKFDGKDNKALTISITRSPNANAADQGTLNRDSDMQKRQQDAADPSKH